MKKPEHLLSSVKEIIFSYAFGVAVGVAFICALPSSFTCIFLGLICVHFLSTSVAPLVSALRTRKRVQASGKAVFITGCDSGFGFLLAHKLDNLGFRVFAGCLQPDSDGACALRKAGLHVVSLDVTKEDSVQEAKEYVVNNLDGDSLWAVVNNAGYNEVSELLWTDMSVIRKVFDVNTFGVVRVTKVFLPLLCRSAGRVVAVASAAGRYTLPSMVPYSMSKQSIISFCDGLRLEMYRFGVQVVTIEPHIFRTQMTSERHVMDNISKAWANAPAESKNLFRDDYIGLYKEQTLKMITFSISENLQDVIACLEEAVTAVDPRYSYAPGTLFSKVAFWCVSHLPKPVADLIIHGGWSVDLK